MAPPSKAVSLSKLNDAVLGSFSRVNQSQTLDHLLRYLSTWSGSDKLFMLIQYTAKLTIPVLYLRARIQHRFGARKDTASASAAALVKLAGIVGDARTLWRIWGLLPIVQWLISLERNPPPTRNLLTIERLQGWSMLAYYPLEHISYLVSHAIIPASVIIPFFSRGKPTALNPGILSKWSCRFWALYVALQFAHLAEDRQLLIARHRALTKAKGKGVGLDTEKAELRRRWDAFWNEVVVNVGYLPLTIHWSLENGAFNNDIWVSVFGFIAAVASFRSGWKATALPPPPASPAAEESDQAGSSSLDRPASEQFEADLALPPFFESLSASLDS